MKKLFIERTKKGYPAFWESGGGYTNTGEAIIIANKDGQPKKAIYIRRRGHLANGEHALVILEVGDYVISANHHREDFNIDIFRIVDFKTEKTIKEEDFFKLKEEITEDEFEKRYGVKYDEFIEGKSCEIKFLTKYYELPSGDYCRKDSWDCIKEVEIYKKETKKKEVTEDVAIVQEVYEFSMGEWDKELPAYLEAAVQAAMEKATCYHCREPHFIIE